MTRNDESNAVDRRAILGGLGAVAVSGLGGFVLGRSSAPEPGTTNWREREYAFWVDVNDWVRKLGDGKYEPPYWQCCGVYLSPGSVGKALRLRHPLNGDEWDYRLVSQSTVASVYGRLGEEESQRLTEEHGDARRADTP